MAKKTKEIILLVLLLFGTICSGGCSGYLQVNETISRNGEVLRETRENARMQEAAKEEKQYREMLDRKAQKDRILNNCTQEFAGYHQLDENFLDWFYDAYGQEVFKELAEYLKEGKRDPDFWYEKTGSTIQVLWLLYCKAAEIETDGTGRVYWKECAKEEEAVFTFCGDINFSEGYVTTRHLDRSENGIYDCFSEELLEEMRRADVMMVNNEFTYSTRGEPVPRKTYTFRADPKRVSLLEEFGTDIAGIANNHVYDFGPDALVDTIDTLDKANIPHVGAGKNIEEAKEPVYFVCNGRKIAIVAATQIERSKNYTKEATQDSPGVLKTLNPEKFIQVIKDTEKNSDLVIAFVHWGTEGDNDYGEDQVKLAEAFVQAGADAIVGGHTHCLQGMEYIQEVPVFYSLGNFWFSSETQDTGLLQLLVQEDGQINLRFLPCIQQNLKTSLVAEPGGIERILGFLEAHSNGVEFDVQGYAKKVQE